MPASYRARASSEEVVTGTVSLAGLTVCPAATLGCEVLSVRLDLCGLVACASRLFASTRTANAENAFRIRPRSLAYFGGCECRAVGNVSNHGWAPEVFSFRTN